MRSTGKLAKGLYKFGLLSNIVENFFRIYAYAAEI